MFSGEIFRNKVIGLATQAANDPLIAKTIKINRS